MAYNRYVSFDWAAKNMLRDKAKFCILEGLITVFLNEKVHIEEILENHVIKDIHYDFTPPIWINCGGHTSTLNGSGI